MGERLRPGGGKEMMSRRRVDTVRMEGKPDLNSQLQEEVWRSCPLGKHQPCKGVGQKSPGRMLPSWGDILEPGGAL